VSHMVWLTTYELWPRTAEPNAPRINEHRRPNTPGIQRDTKLQTFLAPATTFDSNMFTRASSKVCINLSRQIERGDFHHFKIEEEEFEYQDGPHNRNDNLIERRGCL
jgi:hypothetical protein